MAFQIVINLIIAFMWMFLKNPILFQALFQGIY